MKDSNDQHDPAGKPGQESEGMESHPDWSDEAARLAYLERLKKEIEEGTYFVPAEWIAEKIIEAEKID